MEFTSPDVAPVVVTISIIVGIASTRVLTAAVRNIARHRPARPRTVEQSNATDPRHMSVIVGGTAIADDSDEGLLPGRLT